MDDTALKRRTALTTATRHHDRKKVFEGRECHGGAVTHAPPSKPGSGNSRKKASLSTSTRLMDRLLRSWAAKTRPGRRAQAGATGQDDDSTQQKKKITNADANNPDTVRFRSYDATFHNNYQTYIFTSAHPCTGATGRRPRLAQRSGRSPIRGHTMDKIKR